MRLMQRTFRYDEDEPSWLETKEGLGLCDADLRRLFAIPDGITRLEIALHDRSAKGRRRARIMFCKNDLWWQVKVTRTAEASAPEWDAPLARIGKRVVWIEVRAVQGEKRILCPARGKP